MVQDAQVVERLLTDVERCDGLSRLLQAQQVIGTIEQTSVIRCGNHGLSILALDGVAVFGQAFLALEHYRTTLPIGLQLGHRRTLHTRNGIGVDSVEA